MNEQVKEDIVVEGSSTSGNVHVERSEKITIAAIRNCQIFFKVRWRKLGRLQINATTIGVLTQKNGKFEIKKAVGSIH